VLDRVRDHIDYDETGTGPTIVLVPGSCSTGAAWRPVIASFKGRFRCVTTSLLGYGGTTERRSAEDPSISHEAEALEWVIQKAGGRVHLVGHSFGGCVSLAVALRNRVELASLTILQAIATMIDFYGGAGTFASWPERVRAYAVEKTAVNILDWASAYGFPLSAAALRAIDLPTLIATGRASHPAMHAANALLSECISGASLAAIDGAAHFMIATHAGEVARLIAEHVSHAERVRSQRRVLAAVK
jgi:pimeloyl-ACP methyl ester carboxylesterase